MGENIYLLFIYLIFLLLKRINECSNNLPNVCVFFFIHYTNADFKGEKCFTFIYRIISKETSVEFKQKQKFARSRNTES